MMTVVEFHFSLMNLQSSLLKFACSLTTDKDDAKDLVQETFLKALRYRDQFAQDSNFKSWTYTIMKNTFINNYNRAIRQNTYRDQTNDSFFINQSTSHSQEDPDSTYSVLEIGLNIESLKEIYREPFKMHVNGYKYKEIAEALNLNIGTVKSRIFLSRKLLMDQLNK